MNEHEWLAVVRIYKKQIADKKSNIGDLIGKIFLGVLLCLLILLSVVYVSVSDENNKTEAALAAEIERINKLPELPIEVGYREALLGSGLVGEFKNTSNKHLSVRVTMENPTMNSKKTVRLDIAPNELREIGHMEGWAFASGDVITISHDGYKNLKIKMP